MFHPSHVAALAPAAQFIVDLMDNKGLLRDNIPGHLMVTDRDLHHLLTFHVGPRGNMAHNEGIEQILKMRCLRIRDQIGPDGSIKNGIASSDVIPMCAGAIGAKQLIIGYASTGNNCLADEAIAFMLAIKAGLLSRLAVWEHRCDPEKQPFNPELLYLMSKLRWIVE